MSHLVADSIPAPLSQGVGYGIVLGVGAAFAAGMMIITRLMHLYLGENANTTETWAVANRSVETGLTATAVISSWAWSTALLSSSALTWQYGVSGGYWFAAGCLVQISLFALIAIQSKLKTPHAHTVLEVVRARYGRTAHFLYMFLCLANNLIAVCNMLLGASAAISALTGMHAVAATFLLPVGVVLYTITGGLRATFVTDYVHTMILLIILLYLTIKAVTNPAIGSPAHLWDLVRAAGEANPIAGNHGGSYLTMTSKGGVQFGILHTLGNFGLVIMDSSYWQKAYSANISAAVPGYILGGVAYFALPWCLGTIMGLVGIGLQSNPIWPAFGRMLSTTELNNGLVLPYSALATAGKGGAVAVVIIIFMAVTSTTSAQLIAVSSIISTDIYHTYWRPDATDAQVIRVSHLSVIGFALFMSGFSVMLYYVGISLGWTLYFLGIITCPGMVTLCLTILWRKQSWAGAVIGPIVGLVAGIAIWLSTAQSYGDGQLDVTTTGALLPCLWGTIAAAFLPPLISVVLTLVKPQDFDWERFNDIKLISDKADDESYTAAHENTPAEITYMKSRSKIAGWTGLFLFITIWIIWPFAMYGSHYEFSRSFFTGWITVSIIWAWFALFVAGILPLWDGRHVIPTIVLGVLGKKTDKPATEKARRNPDSELASGPRSGSSDSDEGLVSGAESPNEKNGSEKKGPTRSHSEGEADGVIRQEPTLLSNTANVNAAN